MGGSISSGAAKAISLSGRSCLNCRHKASAKVCGGCAEFFSPWGVPSYSKWEPELPSLEDLSLRPTVLEQIYAPDLPPGEDRRIGGTSRPKTEVPTRGLRYNKGKRRYDLLPPDALVLGPLSGTFKLGRLAKTTTRKAVCRIWRTSCATRCSF